MGFFSNIRNFFAGLLRSKVVAEAMQTRFKYPEDMLGRIAVWQSLYMGESVDGTLPEDEPLGLSAMISNDLAKKAMSELRIGVSYGGSSDYDIGLFDDDDMITLREQVEYAIAMGGVLMRPVVKDGKVVQEWYTQDRIIPTDWDRRIMTGVTLVDYFIKKESNGVETTYAKLESHGYSTDDGRYHIRTKAFKDFRYTSSQAGIGADGWVGREIPLHTVPDWADITPDIIIENPQVPNFVYIGTPFSNNKVFNVPLGVSIFKDAVPWIMEFERAFTSAKFENRHGRSKLFVSDSMIPTKVLRSANGGKGIIVDDLSALDNELYRKLSTETGNDLFEQWAPNLRFDSFEKYMNFLLHMVCLTSGLDPSQYVFDEKSYAVTAREIISKQQKTYATICDLQKYMITPAVTHIIDCVRQLQYLYDLPSIPEGIEVSMDYGDSILVDEQAERENALLECNSGLRSKLSYIMTQRNLTEEEAMREIERINEERKASMPLIADEFGA